ncbi:RNA polymerase sigma-70 factor (ECF subfamily) [Algoriphagus ratkowskyi]|uniref:RNA polymerase sigma-70 factor (ECF subfamily) n=1 Tax=Algoriphagus ratkowskyi TaxID=57028 RepID=A0A2W7RLQ2_9BACT|nr:sigma-70 family RNA polymerase sigma factor [Algoriphagus ratkowskyi]PZX61191.1 RNA polymerase sigma-70 factor (ECF subfamily) [Algoriphagus ratkowskyi]TXD79312.1 sigma-70 family RNA polymerase sigma factor [Algoriphagus ratkowskyi]
MQNTIKTDFEQVLENNKDKIYRICKIYAANPIEPEDLFQKVTINLWKSFLSFENKSGINTWVYRIALNVCMRYKNKLENRDGKTIRLESIQFEPTASIPNNFQEERYKALYSCIHLLDEVDQSIVILSLDELPYKEISKITGLTENHIAVKMKRVRKVLLRCITAKLK